MILLLKVDLARDAQVARDLLVLGRHVESLGLVLALRHVDDVEEPLELHFEDFLVLELLLELLHEDLVDLGLGLRVSELLVPLLKFILVVERRLDFLFRIKLRAEIGVSRVRVVGGVGHAFFYCIQLLLHGELDVVFAATSLAECSIHAQAHAHAALPPRVRDGSIKFFLASPAITHVHALVLRTSAVVPHRHFMRVVVLGESVAVLPPLHSDLFIVL